MTGAALENLPTKLNELVEFEPLALHDNVKCNYIPLII